MSTRAAVVSIVGLILVPLAADHVPYVSPYATVLVGAALAVAIVGDTVSLVAITLNWDRPVDALASDLIFGN